MKRTAHLCLVAAMLLAGLPAMAVDNVWTGTTSTSWNVGSNWSLGHTPIASENVSIPATPANQPLISGIAAVCYYFTLDQGASLTISATTSNNATLTSGGGLLLLGSLSIGGTPLQTGRIITTSIEWRSQATFTGYLNSSIEVSDYWLFEAGAAIGMGLTGVKFTGTGNPYIISKSSACSFGNVTISLVSNHSLMIDAGSTAPLYINGTCTINANSVLIGQANINTVLKGDLINSGHFNFNSGYVWLEKTSGTQTIQVNAGDYFNYLAISTGGTVTINNPLTINYDLVISSGIFNPQNQTLTILGNWTNNVGPDAFIEGTGRVVFQTSLMNHYCSNETFNILELNCSLGGFVVDGTSVVCNQYDWSQGGMEVKNYGTFTANDLADAGIFGEYRVNTAGTINLHQDAASLVDLCGSLIFNGGGTINVYGGGSNSEWATYANASLTMSGGTLDFKDQGITALSAAPFTLTTNITGGNIRTTGSFNTDRANMTPTGGFIELYGSGNPTLTYTNGKPYDMRIIKDAGSVVTLNSDLAVNNSLLINTGTLQADNKVITVNSYVNIFNTGKLALGAGTQLKLNSSSINVYSGGTLQTWGSLADNAIVTRSGTSGTYEINLQTGSILSARYSTFQYLNGIRFYAGSTLDPANALYHCTFSNNSGSYTLYFANVQEVSINEANFPNLGSTYNVYKANTSGRVKFKDATGPYAGATYEYDPNNRVDWLTATPGLWTGVASTDWYTASNWDDYTVPVTTTDVTIPAGAPNMPAINSADAYCNNITIQAGASLTVGAGDLNVTNNMTVYGQVIGNNANCDIYIGNDIYWESGSTANFTAGEFRVTGDWEFRDGSNAQLAGGTVLFTGGGLSYIRSYERNSSLYNLMVQKTAGTCYYSNVSTDTLKINGTLTTSNTTSYFSCNSSLPLVLKGQFSNTGHLYCPAGTFIFDGTTHTIDLNTGDYFNHLVISSSGMTTLADSLRIRGNLELAGGPLSAGVHPIFIRGNWNNTEGVEGFYAGVGKVVFEGPEAADILSGEHFFDLEVVKTYIGSDGLEINDSIFIENNLTILDGTLEMNPGSRLYIYSKLTITQYHGLNADDSDVKIYIGDDWIDENVTSSSTAGFNAGMGSTVYFLNLAGIQTVQEKNPFSDVVIDGISTYTRPNQYDMICRSLTIANGIFRLFNYKVTVYDDVYIDSGTLRMDMPDDSLVVADDVRWFSGSNSLITSGTILVGDDWSFADGTNADLGTGNTVRFNLAGSSYITCLDASARFGNLIIGKPAGLTSNTYINGYSTQPLRVSGQMTIEGGNQFFVQENLAPNNQTLVVTGNLEIEPTAELTMAYGGSLQNENASFILNGKLTVGSGTATFSGTFEESATGELAITTGSFTSNAPAVAPSWQYVKGIFTMSGGSFTIVNNSLYFWSTSTNTIQGGTITVGKNFYVSTSTTFQPTAGTVVISNAGTTMGSLSCTLPNYLFDLTIEGAISLSGDLTIKDDLLINSGYLESIIYDIYIGGDWTNNAGVSGFVENQNAVLFEGANNADIKTDETFYDMWVMKTNSSTTALELLYGRTLNVHDLTINDGIIELNGSTVVNISNSLQIESLAGLNADDSPSVSITVGRNWTNNNAVNSATQGFYPGSSSLVTFIYSNEQYLSTAAPQEDFNNLSISKGGGRFRTNDNIRVAGNLDISGGSWEDNVAGLTHTITGNISVGSAGAIFNAFALNTFTLQGSVHSTITYSSSSGSFHDIIINKTAGYKVTQATNVSCLFGGNLMVDNGSWDVNGSNLWVEGYVMVNDNAILAMPAASMLIMTNGDALNVNTGGKLEITGTQASPATLQADIPTSQYNLNIATGGTIAADYAVFKHTGLSGVNVHNGAIVDPDHAFRGCTFQEGAAGGTLLTVSNNQVLTIRNAYFPPNSWGSASNVTKPIGAGHLYFVDFTGAYAGEAFDNDPGNLVDWVATLTVSATSSPHVVCAGSSSQLNAIPAFGLPPYTYLWSPSAGLSDPTLANPVATPASNTIYNVTVTDNLGSTATAWAEVLVSPLLPAGVTITALPPVTTPGTMVTFHAVPSNGGSSPSYQWKVNGVDVGSGGSTCAYQPLNNDQVQCVMTSNYLCATGNPASSNIITMIVLPASIVVTGTLYSPASECYNALNTIYTGGPSGTFTVQNGASATLIAGMRISLQYGTTVLPGGYLHGYITTTNSYCGSMPPPMVVVPVGSGASPTGTTPAGEALEPAGSTSAGEALEPAEARFLLYPNPASHYFILRFQGEGAPGTTSVELFTMQGTRLYSEILKEERSHRFDATGYPPGFYLVKVTRELKTESFKLVLTKY